MNPAGNVVRFERPSDPLAFAPGVTPFERSNPTHVAAWNAMYAFARQELERGARS